ncbi:MAG: glycosyltransferase family 2 protein [Pseudoclavibacter sp.]
MSQPRVTVIAPLFNAAEYLDEFVAKLQATLGPDDEAVIIDDASGDGTSTAIRPLIGDDTRITLLQNEVNLGVAESRNKAVRAARGEFIWFVDHDDKWEPTILDVLISSSNGVDLVQCRADYWIEPDTNVRIVDGVDDLRDITAGEYAELMLKGRIHGYLWSKLLRRTALGETPFPPLTSQSDFSGLAALLPDLNGVRLIPNVLYHYIQREGSITRGKRVNFSNFEYGYKALADSAQRLGVSNRDVLDLFKARFLVHAAAFVPVRQKTPRDVRRAGLKIAHAHSRSINVSRVWRMNRRVGAEMAAIRYAPLVYAPLLKIALEYHDMRVRAKAGR